MQQTEMLKSLREEMKDNVEPYLNTDDELLSALKRAIADYSRYRPRKCRGYIEFVKGQTEYPLPEGYQTWISGLDDYEVLDGILYTDGSTGGVSFVYYASHTIESFPAGDITLLLDFVMWKQFEAMVQEGSEISALKLGKGLAIDFSNFGQLNKAADRRRESYLASIRQPLGGWA
jgi:hypothetical protein